LLLVLTLPLILATAIAIKLESKGPAFYRQRRVGLYGVGFDVIKLRSMRQDAEVGGKAVWAEKDDPRITRIGRFIRKTRIDELPQCWSVLKGEMSFVGPRPERPQFVEDLEQKLPYYAERHMVKPGITGWAQINYPYGASIEDSARSSNTTCSTPRTIRPSSTADPAPDDPRRAVSRGRALMTADADPVEPRARRPAVRRAGAVDAARRRTRPAAPPAGAGAGADRALGAGGGGHRCREMVTRIARRCATSPGSAS
jgi:hypothetical protein